MLTTPLSPHRSGNPDNTVSLNGTDNTIGTARFYQSAGASVIETLTKYSKPANGPYEESHTLAPLFIPAANLSFYSAYDANTATPVCNGAATMFNETVNFCATNATAAAGVLHMLHLQDVRTVGLFLGNQTFSTCEAAKALHPNLPQVVASNGTGNGTATGGNSTAAGNSTSSPSGSGSASQIPSASKVPSASQIPSSAVAPATPASTTTAASTPAAFKGAGTVLSGNVVLAGLVALGVLVM